MINIEKYNDYKYMSLVGDILYNKEFIKTKSIKHHGLSRYEHSIRVSYYAYIITKKFHLDYKKAARAGLLHDFFLESGNDATIKEKIKVLINHPKIAVENAKKYFDISLIEEDIIRTHMFPVTLRVPRYLESWFVVLIDDVCAIYEALSIKGKRIKYALNLLILMLMNYLG